MMKNFLILPLTALLLLSMLAGCNRSLRRDSNSQEPDQPTQAAAAAVAGSTSIPTLEVTATQSVSTEISTIQPTDTLVPTLAASQSDLVANELDALLGQFDSQLKSVDTIPETP